MALAADRVPPHLLRPHSRGEVAEDGRHGLHWDADEHEVSLRLRQAQNRGVRAAGRRRLEGPIGAWGERQGQVRAVRAEEADGDGDENGDLGRG
jgi:hypothetical protein